MLFSSLEFKWQGAAARSPRNWTRHQFSPCEEEVALFTCPPTANTRLFFSCLYSAPSGNIRAAAPGSVSLFYFNFFFCLLQILLLCLHITASLVFRSPSSPWQWNTVTPISGGPSTPKHSCVAVPLSCHRTSRLPTLLPLSSTNSAAFPFHSALFPFTPALPLFSPLPSLALPEDGSVKDKGQTKSQHSLQTSVLYRRSLAPVLHFTFDFSVSVRGTPLRAASVWHATRLPKHPCWIKNTAYAADSTLLCYKEETYPLFRKWSTHLTWTARCLLI